MHLLGCVMQHQNCILLLIMKAHLCHRRATACDGLPAHFAQCKRGRQQGVECAGASTTSSRGSTSSAHHWDGSEAIHQGLPFDLTHFKMNPPPNKRLRDDMFHYLTQNNPRSCNLRSWPVHMDMFVSFLRLSHAKVFAGPHCALSQNEKVFLELACSHGHLGFLFFVLISHVKAICQA